MRRHTGKTNNGSRQLVTPNTVRVYITQHALTKGIIETQAEILNGGRMARVQGPGGTPILVAKNHFTESRSGAVQKAQQMRLKTLNRLRQQIEQLESMQF